MIAPLRRLLDEAAVAVPDELAAMRFNAAAIALAMLVLAIAWVMLP